MIWRNGDGYPDPTAGEAISNIIREERLKERMRRRGLFPPDGTNTSRRHTSLETCFAYIPADVSGGGYPECTALTGGCPGFDKCAFYKGVSRHREDVDRTYEQIRQRPYREQLAISLKYYSGKMPWRMKEKE
jgi:hypothetical protein